MRTSKLSITKLLAVAAAALLFTGCAAEGSGSGNQAASDTSTSDSAQVDAADGTAEAPETPETSDGDAAETGTGNGGGDYAFGTNREQIATAVEAPFKSKNAKARWEGDTLVLAMDGDADEAMAGWTECMAISNFINEGEDLRIEFPNGTIDCTELLDSMG